MFVYQRVWGLTETLWRFVLGDPLVEWRKSSGAESWRHLSQWNYMIHDFFVIFSWVADLNGSRSEKTFSPNKLILHNLLQCYRSILQYHRRVGFNAASLHLYQDKEQMILRSFYRAISNSFSDCTEKDSSKRAQKGVDVTRSEKTSSKVKWSENSLFWCGLRIKEYSPKW